MALVDAGLKTRKPKIDSGIGFAGRLCGRFATSCLLSVLVLAGGCDREKITVYRVPKASALAASMAPADDASEAAPQVQWKTAPTGWTQKPPTESSVLSFAVAGGSDKTAEFSAKPFSLSGVQPLMLINVVRQNAGLPPFSEEEFSKMMQTIPIGREQGSLMDFTSAAAGTNAPATGLMVALLVHDGVTWLFKLVGDAQLVTSQKPAMIDFLKSVSIVNGGMGSPHAHAMASTNTKRDSGASGTGPSTTAVAPPLESANHPTWTVPSGWKEVPPSQMLLAKFSIPGDGSGGADVTVSSFPGDVGGLLKNVNRWRGQVGLEEVAQADLEKSVISLDVNGVKATLVDVNGKASSTGKDMRIIGVIWPRGGETWFYKLTGDPAVAGREKDAFLKFVQSVRYPNG